jgi:hypothetical protein
MHIDPPDAGRAAGVEGLIPDYDLVHQIGKGSYGEVWLARNATGTFRAVKIVRLADFKDSRPYEREFQGLRNFEPISRNHEGFVDVLHVGRDTQRGFFYYTMELADNANSAPKPNAGEAEYQALTLEVLIRRTGRLPVERCLTIAITLAEALHYLHEQGLVHRDIKPSNIVFVDGVPKLADVGLVAHTHDSRSFVGTEGFVPPEGPSTPRGDLYSLGKVVYEMAMGKDRYAFPSPPTMIDEFPDRQELLELNEIITTLCEQEPKDRYANAKALLADLRLVQRGRSLRSAKARRRQMARLGLIAGVVACTLLASSAWRAIKVRDAVGAAALARRVTEPSTLLNGPALVETAQFPMPGGWPTGVFVEDFDGDSEPELIHATPSGEVGVVSLNAQPIRHPWRVHEYGSQAHTFSLAMVRDITGDKQAELLTTWREGTNLSLSVFNQRGARTKEFTAQGAMLRSGARGLIPDSGLKPLSLLPPSALHPEGLLLVNLSSGRALTPRELRCYDIATQTNCWTYPLMASVSESSLVDLNKDGVDEILVATYSSSNGHATGDGADTNAFLMAFTQSGEKLWQYRAGDDYISTHSVISPSATTDCIYTLCCRTEERSVQTTPPQTKGEISAKIKPSRGLPAEGRIVRLDFNGHEVSPGYKADVEISSMLCTDLGGKGKLLVLAPDSHGLLHVLNDELRFQEHVQVVPRTHDWVGLTLIEAVDLDNDGRKELLFTSEQVEFLSGTNIGYEDREANYRNHHDVSIVVLDSELRLLTKHQIMPLLKEGGRPHVKVIHHGNGNPAELAVITEKVTLLRLMRP